MINQVVESANYISKEDMGNTYYSLVEEIRIDQ
jgi:hypothetical protein